MNTSAWPASENARTVLDRWFAEYPVRSRNDLRARFRRDDKNHESAFFELFLHEVFRRLGLSPEVHPRPSTGHSRPDFRITSRSRRAYYVEANVLMEREEVADDPLEDELLDAIDEIAADQPTRIALSAMTRGRLFRSHSRRAIQNEVRTWLEGIGAETDLDSLDPSNGPRLVVRRDDWVLEIVAFGPLSKPSRRLIHLGPTKFAWGNDGEPLKRNILGKAKQHGKLDLPLIVAMNTANGFQGAEDELSALFGQRSTPRDLDGVWRGRSGNRYRRVHGVLFFRGVRPSNANSVTSRLYVNPYIQADIPEELLQLGNARLHDGKWQWETGLPFGELLELPDDWPGERTVSLAS